MPEVFEMRREFPAELVPYLGRHAVRRRLLLPFWRFRQRGSDVLGPIEFQVCPAAPAFRAPTSRARITIVRLAAACSECQAGTSAGWVARAAHQLLINLGKRHFADIRRRQQARLDLQVMIGGGSRYLLDAVEQRDGRSYRQVRCPIAEPPARRARPCSRQRCSARGSQSPITWMMRGIARQNCKLKPE